MKWKSMLLASIVAIVIQKVIPMWTTVSGISILAVGVFVLILIATEIYLAGKEDEIDEIENEESMGDEEEDFEEEIEI